MSKLYFRYGAMNSSKSANLLMVAHNYEEQGKKVIIFKPSLDTRSGESLVKSRVGIEHICKDICKDFNFYEYMKDAQDIDCVLVDESQFCTKEQIKQLTQVADKLNIPVLCYGLKNTYIDGELFEGSAALLYYADSIEEIKTVCQYCNRKAIMNLYLINGQPIYQGNKVQIGDVKGEEKYVSVCREHYFNTPKIK